MDNPLHRIEGWTGKYFRSAALWQVGVYVVVHHHGSGPYCGLLDGETNIINGFQEARDLEEQQKLARGQFGPAPADVEASAQAPGNYQPNKPAGGPVDNDVAADTLIDATLDRIYNRRYGVDGTAGMVLEPLDDEEAESEEEIEIEIPAGYMPHGSTRIPDSDSFCLPEQPPRTDALLNPYVRVVHTNGIHNLALIVCRCRGDENTHADLVAAGFVPTSFTRYQTIFTHQVLDDFRISTLECKSSAYQYFQKLRRHTSPMDPESVPNLYHELRRISRVWRWMKKLKWAGFGHTVMDHNDPAPGILANFCPACPQPGINLPDNWVDDPKRCATVSAATS
jgi:hypothetical protein